MDTNTFFKKFMETPVAKKILADDQNNILADRRQGLADIALIDKNWLTARDGFDTKIKKSEAAIILLRDQLKNAELQHGELMRLRQISYRDAEREKLQIQKRLARLYPPEIDVFIHDMQTLMALHQQKVQSTTQNYKVHRLTDEKYEHVSTNVLAINKALDYMRNTIGEAELLKMSELDRDTILAMLDNFRIGVPSIDVFDSVDRFPPDSSDLRRPLEQTHGTPGGWFNAPH